MPVNNGNEFNEKNWMKTSIIKLQRLICFHEELASERETLAKLCNFNVWVDYENSYTIRANKFGFYVEGFGPITYEELIDILFRYNDPQSDRNVVQNFIEKFFYFGSCVPAQLSPEVNDILQTPVCREEYENVEKIIKGNKKKTALGWLDKVRALSNTVLYDRFIAEGYIKKAQKICPQVDASEVWGIIENKNKQ